MKKNNLISAILFLAAGIILFAVSKAEIRPKLADFCFGASLPMFLAGLIAIIKYYIDNKKAKA